MEGVIGNIYTIVGLDGNNSRWVVEGDFHRGFSGQVYRLNVKVAIDH